MRKILILARESGHALEMEEITSDSFLPASSLAADSVDDFMATLGKEEEHFQQLLQAKPSPEHRLKYVASYEEGKASTGLQYIAPNHPFYELNGSDNIVLFFTDRYPEQPLIIKGAGAGADVTASGIFADIIRIGNF
jgi:aspartokinase/homoserine dehydrogenase 1